MKYRILSLVLAAVLLFSLSACGTAAPPAADPAPAPAAPAEETEAPAEATPAPTEEPVDYLSESAGYADAYLNFLNIANAVTDEVNHRMEASNAVLEGMYPDSYYMNSSYLMMVFLPFTGIYPAAIAEAVMQDAWDGAVITCENGVYRSEFTFVYGEKSEEGPVDRDAVCTWQLNDAGAFRVEAYVDGLLAEVLEFAPQGEDVYRISTLTDKALVEYRDGRIVSLFHAHRISAPAQDTFPGDVRPCTDTFYPDGKAEREWITLDPDAEYIITLENDDMVYSGVIGQDLLDAEGNKTGVEWVPIDPIPLLK